MSPRGEPVQPLGPDAETLDDLALRAAEALETLDAQSPELAEAVVLRDVGELDYNEIARLLDVPLGTVKSRIHKARQRLRPMLVLRG